MTTETSAPYLKRWKFFLLLHVAVWIAWPFLGGAAGTAFMLLTVPLVIAVLVSMFGWRNRDSTAWYGTAWVLGLTAAGSILGFLSTPVRNVRMFGIWSEWWPTIHLLGIVDFIALLAWLGKRHEFGVDPKAGRDAISALHGVTTSWLAHLPLKRFAMVIILSGMVFLGFVVATFGMCSCGPNPWDLAVIVFPLALGSIRLLGYGLSRQGWGARAFVAVFFCGWAALSALVAQWELSPTWSPEQRFGISPDAWLALACYSTCAWWTTAAGWVLVSRRASNWFERPPLPLPAQKPALF